MKFAFKLLLIFIINTSFCFAQVSRNFNKLLSPIFELGVGAGYLNVPNYPGAKNSSFYFIPFPVAIYRGELLRADEDGTRARLLRNRYFEIGLSAGFNFPIKSSENDVRKGMPDKPALLGLGPSFLFKLLRNKYNKLTAGLGVRANFETSNFEENGLLVEPFFRYWFKLENLESTTFFLGASYSAASKRYHSFFYNVDEEFKNSNRPIFISNAGTVDYTYSLGLTIDFSSSLSFYTGVVYSDLSDSVSIKSPLLEKEKTIGYGIGFTWLLFESETLVK